MQLVRNLPQQYREDPWVLALADAILGVLEDQDAQSVSIREQLSLDTITWALEIEEALAGIVPPADAGEPAEHTEGQAAQQRQGHH